MIINVTVPPISRVVKVGTASVNAGKDGKSAYQIAVDNGFIGTEAAWLASLNGEAGAAGLPCSLTVGDVLTLGPTSPAIVLIEGEAPNQTVSFGIPRGAKGDKGDKGDVGPQGIQGPVGPSGIGIPGGSATQIQFNDAGTFGGSNDLTWDGTKLNASQVQVGDVLWSPSGSIGAQSNASNLSLHSASSASGTGASLYLTNAASDAGSIVLVPGAGDTGANGSIQFYKSSNSLGPDIRFFDTNGMPSIKIGETDGIGYLQVADQLGSDLMFGTLGGQGYIKTKDEAQGALVLGKTVFNGSTGASIELQSTNDSGQYGSVVINAGGSTGADSMVLISVRYNNALGFTTNGSWMVGPDYLTGTVGQVLTSAGNSASPTWTSLASVATSGSYTDLTNKPDIPTLPSQTGQTGKFLSTDGTSLSWASAGAGGSTFYKDPVRVATTASGTLATAFASGQSIDGVTLVTGNRILIKDQTTASQNGIYVVNATGAPTRATDFDENSEAQRGCIVYVQEGSRNGGSNFQVVSSDANPVVIGTSTINFSPASSFMVAGSSSMKPEASGTNAIAIGNAKGLGSFSIGIGIGAEASTTEAIGIGRLAVASGMFSIAMGRSSYSSGAQSVAIGYQAKSYSDDSVALGSYSNTSKTHSVAIKAVPATNQSMAWGPYSKLTIGGTFQRETFFYGGNTTSATPTNLSHRGSDPLSLGAWMHYEIRATVQATNMTSIAYNSGKFAGEYRWVISTNGDATRLFVLSPKTTIYEYNPYGLPWSLEAVVVNPGILQFQATGEASTTIRWFVTVELTSMYCAN